MASRSRSCRPTIRTSRTLRASLARKWFNDRVQAIADGGSSGAALAVQELVRANAHVFLISGAGANQLTDEACAPTSVQWTHDAYSTATALVSGIMQSSKEPWFFITGDYAFGHSVEATARARIAELGGMVAGSVKAQLGTPDYSSFLLQAQSFGAKILALNVAGDNATAIKQAEEFGLAAQGMKIVPMSFQNVDIHAVGLKATRGDLILTSFFEDASPAARRFSDAFYALRNAMPSQIQAGVYSAVRHYLQAVKDADSDDGPTVMAKMRVTPVVDAYTQNGRIRRRPADGTRSLSGSGEDARGIQGPVGFGQARRDCPTGHTGPPHQTGMDFAACVSTLQTE